MNQLKHTFGAWLAVVFVLLLTFLPHHHHEGGAVCWVTEVCHNDGRVNDEHTAHGHADQHSNWCIWQKQAMAYAASASAPGQGGLQHFLPLDFWRNAFSAPIVYSYTDKQIVAACQSLSVCPWGKHVRRRGPPAVC